MAKSKLLSNLLCVVALTLPVAVRASAVYQSIPDLTVAPAINGWCSVCVDHTSPQAAIQQVGQQFTLATGGSIGSVLFTVTSYYHWPTAVTLSVYSDGASNALGTEVFTRTYLSFDSLVSTLFSTDIVGVNTPGLVLAAGTYDLLLTNATGLAIPGYDGFNGNGDEIVLYSASFPPGVGANYSHMAYDAGLVLQSEAIPEPGTLALVGLGILGIVFGGRHRR